jgi:hypothetical protein
LPIVILKLLSAIYSVQQLSGPVHDNKMLKLLNTAKQTCTLLEQIVAANTVHDRQLKVTMIGTLHTAKTQYGKIRNKYSQKRNCLPILLQENICTDPGNR